MIDLRFQFFFQLGGDGLNQIQDLQREQKKPTTG
jgi:hypothetical protein